MAKFVIKGERKQEVTVEWSLEKDSDGAILLKAQWGNLFHSRYVLGITRNGQLILFSNADVPGLCLTPVNRKIEKTTGILRRQQ